MANTRTPKRKASLTTAERDTLAAELRAELEAPVRSFPTGADARELTPREKATRLLIRERDHMDGCPVYEDETKSAGRVEAYANVRPANPSIAEPAKTMTVVRCIECGGSRVLEGTVTENLLNALGDAGGPADDGELDHTL